jgi:VWFA-related protein
MRTGFGFHSALIGVLLCAPMAGLAQFAQGQSFSESMMPAGIAGNSSASNEPDSSLYADGTRAINEGRWSDAIEVFAKVAQQHGDHADGALYWKAYAENKQGKAKPALKTCVELRREFPKSRWIDECGALEIEIRAKNGEPVQPNAEKDENLKLLALNSLMRKNEALAVAQIQEILESNSSEALKKGAEFILAQGHSNQARELLAQIAQKRNASTRSDASLHARTATMANAAGSGEGSASSKTDAGSRRVTLDVVVSDKSGKPVSGLGSGDFTLLDNGQPNRILSFQAVDGTVQKADPPVEVMLLIDAANVGSQGVVFEREQVERFLRQNDGHLAQPVSIFVLTDRGLSILSSPSADGNALAEKVSKIEHTLRTNQSAGEWGAVQRFQFSVQTLSAIAQSEAKKPGRKLMLWLGSGWPMFDSSRPPVPSREQQQQWFDSIVQLSTQLRAARISVYTMLWGAYSPSLLYQDYLSGVKTADKANTANLTLKVMAVQSGGRVMGPNNDLAEEINSAIADGNAFYTISFDPPPADRANEYHYLKVQIAKPKLTARTTTGYYAQP